MHLLDQINIEYKLNFLFDFDFNFQISFLDLEIIR